MDIPTTFALMHKGVFKNYIEKFLTLYWGDIISTIIWMFILMLVGIYGAFKNFKTKNQIYNVPKENTKIVKTALVQTPTKSPRLSRSHSWSSSNSSSWSCSDVSWQPSSHCSTSSSIYTDSDSGET